MANSSDFVRADPLAEASAAASAQLAQLVADHRAAPEQQLTRARERKAQLPNHVDRHIAAEREIAALEAKARGETGIVLSDAERLDLALGGQLDHLGAEVTAGSQVPVRDFNAAIQDDLKLGVRPELLRIYHATGKSDDRLGHIGAAIWLERFKSDPELQRRFLVGYPEVRLQYRLAHIYLAGAHEGVSPEDEAAYRARFSAYP
jgi:hypothetical protein